MLRILENHVNNDRSTSRQLDELFRLPTTPGFNIKAVEQATDTLASTLRAWERRYGILAPQRTESGYRLYSERDIAIIRWLRAQLDQGMTISQAAALLTARLSDTMSRRPQPELTDLSPLDAMQVSLRDALLSLDEAEANPILTDAFSRFPVERVCLQLLQPVMFEIGTGWYNGEVSIAQEHFASHWVRQKLLGLMAAIPMRATGRPIITASAPTDQHEIGILFVALFLQRAGWEVIHLGVNLAADGLAETFTALRPAMVLISATHAASARRISDIAQEIERMTAPRPILGFGGQVFNHDMELRHEITGIFLGENAEEVVATVDRLLRPN